MKISEFCFFFYSLSSFQLGFYLLFCFLQFNFLFSLPYSFHPYVRIAFFRQGVVFHILSDKFASQVMTLQIISIFPECVKSAYYEIFSLNSLCVNQDLLEFVFVKPESERKLLIKLEKVGVFEKFQLFSWQCHVLEDVRS